MHFFGHFWVLFRSFSVLTALLFSLLQFSLKATQGEIEVAGVISTTSTPGIYNVQFPLTVTGFYQITGSYAGSLAFIDEVTVSPGPVMPTQSSFTSNSPGHTGASAGEKASIYIQGRDTGGNPIAFADDYEVTIEGTARRRDSFVYECVKDTTSDYAQQAALHGISVYTYTITQSGTFSLYVRINGTLMAGSPSALTVSPTPAVLAGASLQGPTSALVGEQLSYTLALEDQYGNPVSGADTVSAILVGT